MKTLSNPQLAYVLARLTLGVNLFFHGVVRMPKIQGFVSYIESTFSGSMVPGFLVTPMAWLIPIAELILGILLLVGLQTRKALVGAALLMILLITGSCLIENWGVVGSQMVYGLFIYVLIAQLDHNRWELPFGKKN